MSWRSRGGAPLAWFVVCLCVGLVIGVGTVTEQRPEAAVPPPVYVAPPTTVSIPTIELDDLAAQLATELDLGVEDTAAVAAILTGDDGAGVRIITTTTQPPPPSTTSTTTTTTVPATTTTRPPGTIPLADVLDDYLPPAP